MDVADLVVRIEEVGETAVMVRRRIIVARRQIKGRDSGGWLEPPSRPIKNLIAVPAGENFSDKIRRQIRELCWTYQQVKIASITTEDSPGPRRLAEILTTTQLPGMGYAVFNREKRILLPSPVPIYVGTEQPPSETPLKNGREVIILTPKQMFERHGKKCPEDIITSFPY